MNGKDQKLSSMYRAKVIENRDPELYGRIKVWIPDVMPEVQDTKGLWAFPANNPVGGRNTDSNECDFYGTCYIPKVGSWVWIFFEAGNINRPYYLASLDIKSSKVLPECQIGSNPQEKWVIFKSKDGRCVIISDDSDDARVEITGKKRNLSGPPAGDTGSVYTIDGNQTTILLDERDGSEKILIRTHKGDYLNIDIENRKFHAQFEDEIHIKSSSNIYIYSLDTIHLKASNNIDIMAQNELNLKSTSNVNVEAGSTMSNKAGSEINSDAGMINDQGGKAVSAEDARDAVPEGQR